LVISKKLLTYTVSALKQDTQCTHKATMWSFCGPIVAMEH